MITITDDQLKRVARALANPYHPDSRATYTEIASLLNYRDKTRQAALGTTRAKREHHTARLQKILHGALLLHEQVQAARADLPTIPDDVADQSRALMMNMQTTVREWLQTCSKLPQEDKPSRGKPLLDVVTEEELAQMREDESGGGGRG